MATQVIFVFARAIEQIQPGPAGVLFLSQRVSCGSLRVGGAQPHSLTPVADLEQSRERCDMSVTSRAGHGGI